MQEQQPKGTHEAHNISSIINNLTKFIFIHRLSYHNFTHQQSKRIVDSSRAPTSQHLQKPQQALQTSQNSLNSQNKYTH